MTAKWLSAAEREQVSITASDYETMKAELITPPEDSHNWVILLHGYSRNRERVYNYARFYAEKGFGLLMPDMRGHGESGGKYVGMGWLDRNDILLWIDMILSRDNDAQIVLHGVSMGAAAAMMTAGEDIPGNVSAVVEDCGYTSVWDIFSDVMWDNAGVPEFPLLHTSSLFSKLLAGYAFEDASALEQIKKTAIPVLFIHGSDDSFVHTEMIYALYDACPTKKEIYIAEGASHGKALYIDPETYFERVFSFLTELGVIKNAIP